MIFAALILSFPVSFVLTELTERSTNRSQAPFKEHAHSFLQYLYCHTFFYGTLVFLLHLPVYLAFYPGICYYDIGTQIEQYETGHYIANHPLIHTYVMGFFKNLFENPNTGYGIILFIQMLFVSFAIGYGLKTLFQYTRSFIICTIITLFYGLCPVYPLLAISSTKDIFFSAFMFIFIIDTVNLLKQPSHSIRFHIRFTVNALFMLMLRNNAFYAFIPVVILILLKKSKKRTVVKNMKILFAAVSILYLISSKVVSAALNADPGSIKEMMSIPAQEIARIYSVSDNQKDKELIKTYVEEPELYNYYLADPIKCQLPFEIFESSCKHFLLDSFILNFKYPIPCIDAIFYNTQGYWDLFHSPYQSDHFFLATGDYRGEAVFDSKLPRLADSYIRLFHTTQNLQNNFLLIPILNSGIYIWIFLFCLAAFIRKKDNSMIFCCLFPLFYLGTLCLGPGAIIRYTFPFLLLSPILLFLTLIQTKLSR